MRANILGIGSYDPWRVNTDAEYHESHDPANDRTGRAVPTPKYARRPTRPAARNR